MCGRFLLGTDIEDIISSYKITNVKNMMPVKGEIFPGTNIPVVMNNNSRVLDFFRWGFIVKGLDREVINARIETANVKSSFKKAFINNRCIIPANAFFEWESCEKNKVKYKISVDDGELFSMAGIYDMFIGKDNNPYFGVAILTRPANEDMIRLHHRMPVIIGKEEENEWLSGSSEKILKLQEKLENSNSVNLHIAPIEGAKQFSIYDMM
jgi:putative SOS response-associated peptidase YedK